RRTHQGVGRSDREAARRRDPEGGRCDAARGAGQRRPLRRRGDPGEATHVTNEAGPGVPEALPRTLAMVVDRLGAERIDRLWIFPPLIRGRREWGLVAASAYADGGERRLLHTAPY